jgi:hypothetical protein
MPLDGFSDFKRDIRSAKRTLERGAKPNARRAARRGVQRGRERIIAQDTVASTKLFRQMGAESQPTDELAAYQLYNRASYAGYVDKGTGDYGPYPSGNPSRQTIRQWMRVKPTFRVPANPRVANAVAEFIRQKIAERGTEPQPFWDAAKDAAMDRLVEESRETLERAFD